MSREEDLIKKMVTYYRRSTHQLNNVYESDAEIIEFFGTKLLINIDEFSKEDHFQEHDPFSLGWNAAVGSMSDIFATGGKPLFAGHSFVVKKEWSEEYILEFNRGVSDALEKAGVDFIGGDFGTGDSWRYTATVFGVPHSNAVKRSGAAIGDQIFITGEIGRGNTEALLSLMEDKKELKPVGDALISRFPLRNKEAELVSKYASSCIDTSDGAYNCMNALAEQSDTGFAIEKLYLLEIGELATELANIPSILLFIAEAGEYELLLTVGEDNLESFNEEAKKENLKFFPLGKLTDKKTKTVKHKNRVYDFTNFSIRARDYSSIEKYIEKLILWARRQDG